MAMKNGRINLILGSMVCLLAAITMISMYRNIDRPSILEPAPSDASSPGLPKNHPPLDVAGRLNSLEQMSLNDPENADLKTQIGNVYYDLGQYQKALDAYSESLKLKPQDPGVETDQATCYHYLGQYDTALEVLNRVLAYRPNYPQALFNKGIVLLDGKKDTQQAIAVWEQLLQTNPSFPQRSELENRLRQLRSSQR